MMTALTFVGFQPFHPIATLAILLGTAIVGIALLPTVKAKLVAVAALCAMVIGAGASLYAQGVTYPPVNHCDWWWIFLCL